MWRLLSVLPLCARMATAAETTDPFPLGVYWPWERLRGHAERLRWTSGNWSSSVSLTCRPTASTRYGSST